MTTNGAFRILYVCDNNFIRSPAAAIITNQRARTYGLDIVADSAGMDRKYTMFDPNMENVLRGRKYDGFRYTSKEVSKAVLDPQDIILCMNSNHIADLEKRMPELTERGNVFTFTQTAGYEELDMPDPPSCIRDTAHTPESYFFRLPLKLRLRTYRKHGYVYAADTEAVIGLFETTATNIENCVDRVLHELFKTEKKPNTPLLSLL